MKNNLKDITNYIKVEITEVGFADPQGLQGILILTAKDGRTIPITAFSGEVAQHIKRFINGDRTSLPTIYKLVEELAEYTNAITQKNKAESNLKEIEKKIIKILESKVRPAVEKDGGDIIFKSYENGIVTVKLQGSCSGCPSSTMTLKQGVQNLLCHYIPEIKEVIAV